MKIDSKTLAELAQHLEQERKRQGLTRAQASAISNVSISFIRDAETNPGKCSLELLLRLLGSLGLSANVAGWQGEPEEKSKPARAARPRKAAR